MWTGEDNLLCDTTKDCIETKKLAADREVAYSERALGVNVGLNPRKRNRYNISGGYFSDRGGWRTRISEKKTFVNKFNGTNCFSL